MRTEDKGIVVTATTEGLRAKVKREAHSQYLGEGVWRIGLDFQDQHFSEEFDTNLVDYYIASNEAVDRLVKRLFDHLLPEWK